MMYLASPYSDPSPRVMVQRYRQVCAVTADMCARGLKVFSPIVQRHVLSQVGGLPSDYGFWREYDEAMIRACEQFAVLRLPGWRESDGVTAEIKYVRWLERDILYVDMPKGLKVRVGVSKSDIWAALAEVMTGDRNPPHVDLERLYSELEMEVGEGKVPDSALRAVMVLLCTFP